MLFLKIRPPPGNRTTLTASGSESWIVSSSHRGSAVLLTVGSLQVDQQASSSWGVLSIAASLRNLTASALMPRGPNGAGVRPPGALSPSGDTLPLSTGVYDGAESEPSLSREGSPPVAKGVRLSWAGRAPPGGPARTKIGPDGPWLDHESEVATVSVCAGVGAGLVCYAMFISAYHLGDPL